MTALCRGVRLLILLVGIAGVALTAQSPADGQEQQAIHQPIKFPDTQYEPIDWADLNGWDNDDHEAAFATYLASCRALNVKRHSDARGNQHGRELTGIAAALRDICERAQAAIPLDDDGAKQFFEDNFRPL